MSIKCRNAFHLSLSNQQIPPICLSCGGKFRPTWICISFQDLSDNNLKRFRLHKVPKYAFQARGSHEQQMKNCCILWKSCTNYYKNIKIACSNLTRSVNCSQSPLIVLHNHMCTSIPIHISITVN